MRTGDDWSIGIYRGPSPIRLSPCPGILNPVLTREQVRDVPACFVADPFMVQVDGIWHLFFEVMNGATERGEIGHATSRDGLRWRYRSIVLAEPFHLSYPFVFEYGGDFYLMPETRRGGALRLYRARRFPDRWEHFLDLKLPGDLADPTLLRHDGWWWLFVDESTGHRHDVLGLYVASTPLGPWEAHPLSPVVSGDPSRARPAGRIVPLGSQLIRYAQDCVPRYGTAVRVFSIDELTPRTYRERELDGPLLGPGSEPWRVSGMHHVDAHPLPDGSWLACVDGWTAVGDRQTQAEAAA